MIASLMQFVPDRIGPEITNQLHVIVNQKNLCDSIILYLHIHVDVHAGINLCFVGKFFF